MLKGMKRNISMMEDDAESWVRVLSPLFGSILDISH